MKKTPRRKYGTKVSEPKPFRVYALVGGGLGVDVKYAHSDFRCREVSIGPMPLIVSVGDAGLQISGDGVIERHGQTVRINP